MEMTSQNDVVPLFTILYPYLSLMLRLNFPACEITDGVVQISLFPGTRRLKFRKHAIRLGIGRQLDGTEFWYLLGLRLKLGKDRERLHRSHVGYDSGINNLLGGVWFVCWLVVGFIPL